MSEIDVGEKLEGIDEDNLCKICGEPSKFNVVTDGYTNYYCQECFTFPTGRPEELMGVKFDENCSCD